MSKYRVIITSKVLAHKWWGQKWCQNIENYADFSNRLERGRSYIRSGKVHDITIEQSNVTTVSAKVDGSMDEPYYVKIFIQHLPEHITKRILSKVANLNNIKNGFVPSDYKFLFSVEKDGLFPTNEEIKVECNCPDVAVLCKHVAAVLYAVGSILDQEPLLLFQLRGIDVDSYLDAEIREKTNELLVYAKNFNDEKRLIEDDLIAEMFGIDLQELHLQAHNSITQPIQPLSSEKVRTILIKPIQSAKQTNTVHKAKNVPTKVLRSDHSLIRQYSLDGTFIAQYETYDDAAKQTGINKRIMQRNVCGERKSGGGYIWKKEAASTPCEQASTKKIDVFQDKPVCQFEYNEILIAEYNSIGEAANKTGINIDSIRDALNGFQKQAGGYIWAYKYHNIIREKSMPIVKNELDNGASINTTYDKGNVQQQNDSKTVFYDKSSNQSFNQHVGKRKQKLLDRISRLFKKDR